MFKRIFVLGIALIAVLAVEGTAKAVVITFDDLESPSSSTRPSYSSSGYTFTSSRAESSAFGTWGSTLIYYNTSAALFNNYSSATTYLRADSGGLFNLESMDLDLLRLTGTVDVTFKGYDVFDTLTGTVIVHLPVDGWFNINFSGIFSDVKYVEWTQTGVDLHQFDNVTVSDVPEPGTLLLLGSGLLGLGFLRRRLKK